MFNIVLGVLVGEFLHKVKKKRSKRHSKKQTNESSKEQAKKPVETKERKTSKHTVKKKFKQYFDVTNPTDQAITSDDISISVNSGYTERKQTNEPNFIALTVLWSHFQALEQGTLEEGIQEPWKKYDVNEKWAAFLANIIQDQSWTRWIQNPEEVKLRAIDAYSKI